MKNIKYNIEGRAGPNMDLDLLCRLKEEHKRLIRRKKELIKLKESKVKWLGQARNRRRQCKH